MPAQKHPRIKDDQPHDAVFKAFFSDAKIAKNYLLHYTAGAIHRHIDFTAFQKVDTAKLLDFQFHRQGAKAPRN